MSTELELEPCILHPRFLSFFWAFVAFCMVLHRLHSKWIYPIGNDGHLQNDFHDFEVHVLEVELFELQGVVKSIIVTKGLMHVDHALISSFVYLLYKFYLHFS